MFGKKIYLIAFTLFFSIFFSVHSRVVQAQQSPQTAPNVSKIVSGSVTEDYSMYSPFVLIVDEQAELYYGHAKERPDGRNCDFIYRRTIDLSQISTQDWSAETVVLYPGDQDHQTGSDYQGGDADCVHDPSIVIKPDGDWIMYYTGAGGETVAEIDSQSKIFYATSSDAGSTWTKQGLVKGLNQVLGSGQQFFHPDILYYQETYYLFYFLPTSNQEWSAYVAESSDGETFSNPVRLGINGQNPDISIVNGRFVLLYNRPIQEPSSKYYDTSTEDHYEAIFARSANSIEELTAAPEIEVLSRSLNPALDPAERVGTPNYLPEYNQVYFFGSNTFSRNHPLNIGALYVMQNVPDLSQQGFAVSCSYTGWSECSEGTRNRSLQSGSTCLNQQVIENCSSQDMQEYPQLIANQNLIYDVVTGDSIAISTPDEVVKGSLVTDSLLGPVFRFGSALRALDINGNTVDLTSWNQSASPFVARYVDGSTAVGGYQGSTFTYRDQATGDALVRFDYGGVNEVVVFGDFTGNGFDTPAVFRDGTWLINHGLKPGAADNELVFGQAGDIPIVGDWDGDGIDTPGIWRNGTFYLMNSSYDPNQVTVLQATQSQGQPVVGKLVSNLPPCLIADFTGDGAVNLFDYNQLAGAFFTQGANLPQDLSGDGTVNLADYTLFISALNAPECSI